MPPLPRQRIAWLLTIKTTPWNLDHTVSTHSHRSVKPWANFSPQVCKQLSRLSTTLPAFTNHERMDVFYNRQADALSRNLRSYHNARWNGHESRLATSGPKGEFVGQHD